MQGKSKSLTPIPGSWLADVLMFNGLLGMAIPPTHPAGVGGGVGVALFIYANTSETNICHIDSGAHIHRHATSTVCAPNPTPLPTPPPPHLATDCNREIKFLTTAPVILWWHSSGFDSRLACFQSLVCASIPAGFLVRLCLFQTHRVRALAVVSPQIFLIFVLLIQHY